MNAAEPHLDSQLIPCRDPATGESLGSVTADSPGAVADAVAAARRAQDVWAKSSFATRRRVLRGLLDHILDHTDDLCHVISRDSGKTLENAVLGEIWPVCEKLRWTIRHGERHLRTEKVSSGLFPHKRARIEYHPRGVVGVIAPWNYPLQNVLGPVIPALMAGNGCIVKVSEEVAWSSARIQRIFDDVFDANGIPRELVRIVNGYGDTGAALVRSGVDLIIFTGSPENGRRVIEGSADSITPVILELGGKDAMIICDDAELPEAVHAALAGVFIAAGQNCMAAERILVFDGIYDRFVEELSRRVSELRQKPPLAGEIADVGAIVSARQLDIIDELVSDAVKRGATLVTGGHRSGDRGQFYAPTVLTDVTEEMLIWRRETFGPVMAIRRVAGEEDAVSVANDTEFGLSSSIFTRSQSRAQRLAQKLRTGSTCVNGFGLTYMAQDLPFGGVDGSGFGRLNGREGLRACTNQKAVLYDRLPVHRPVKLFPVKVGDYESVQAWIQSIYRPGAVGRVRGALGWLERRRRRSER